MIAVIKPLNRARGCVIQLYRANGQLNGNVKVVRKPKSLWDMVIP